ncbi:MAG TPA: hypothetical protein VKB69_07400, partial [Micromonosporaceae bacterium]|nr:hypothetical protein [Micromonosporaceae bacterium]
MSIATARIPRIACAGLLALLAAAACAKPSPGTTGSTQSQLTDHTTARTGVPCALPPAAPFDSSPWMGGPALTALSGGAARQSFSLDSGALTIEPPRQTDIPSVPIGQAKCDAFASDAAIGNFAGGGLAIGYGRVTVRRDLLGGQTVQVVNDADTVAPTLPATPTYLDRLAWVLVVRSQFAVPCPMQVNPPPTPDTRPTDYDYQVFLLDASTGGAA